MRVSLDCSACFRPDAGDTMVRDENGCMNKSIASVSAVDKVHVIGGKGIYRVRLKGHAERIVYSSRFLDRFGT